MAWLRQQRRIMSKLENEVILYNIVYNTVHLLKNNAK